MDSSFRMPLCRHCLQSHEEAIWDVVHINRERACGRSWRCARLALEIVAVDRPSPAPHACQFLCEEIISSSAGAFKAEYPSKFGCISERVNVVMYSNKTGTNLASSS